jgi:P4 family phage/plasmid primase-like protien
LTTSESPSASSPITSDIPTATTSDWLEEPTMPKKEDFNNPENFEFAFNEYKQKLTTYQARLKLHKACEEITAEQEKSPFKCMIGKRYPSYEGFIEEDDSGNKLPFKTASVAKWIHENENIKTDIKTDILYFYDGKSWLANGEAYLQKIVSTILGKEDRESHYRNILYALKGLTLCNIEFSSKIACENGLLDVETLELTKFSEEEMPFFSIPTEYIKDSQCPQFQEWLNQVMPNKDDQKTLQEWSGYILLPDYRFHKLLYNYGGGRNGKGTWERTIQAVIGKNNCSEVGLEELDGTHRFALYQLYGKLFNSCSEPATNRILQTSILKKATGQDVISAERKGSDKRIDFTNTAKITVSANKFPKVKDTSTAFVERRLFITWENSFLEGEGQIQWIERNWIRGEHDERKGILCWMFEGLQRLLIQGQFTESKSQQETEIAFQRASDTIGAFFTEMAIYGKNFATTRKEALVAYEDYCETYNLDAENAKAFTQRLEDNHKISRGKVDGDRAWRGVSFKKLKEEETDGTDGTLLHDYTPQLISENILKKKQGEERVLAVLTVPLLQTDQLKVVTDESGLRRIETNNLVSAKRFRPKPGVLCQTIDHDLICAKEAEYSINGNLYCPTDYEAEKENLRKIGKTVCVEWAEEVS